MNHASLLVAALSLSGATVASRATAAPFTDRDEGSTGPVQDAHQGEVVFSNVVIPRKGADASKLVKRTSLTKPLYVRAYLPKTPAALFNDKSMECDEDARAIWFFARAAGAKDAVELYRMDLPNLFAEIRTQTLTDLDGGIVPVLPGVVTAFDGDANPVLLPFASLVAGMKIGDNPVEFEAQAGCKAQGKYGRRLVPASKATITFAVAKDDIAKAARLYTVRSGDGSATGRLKARYPKGLVAGAKMLSFAADATRVDPMVEQTSSYRVFLRNADKTCSYSVGRWVEPYLGGGRYAEGAPDVTHTEYTIPCP